MKNSTRVENYNMPQMVETGRPLDTKATTLFEKQSKSRGNLSGALTKSVDFDSKVLSTQWHPKDENTVVGSNKTSIFLFSKGHLVEDEMEQIID